MIKSKDIKAIKESLKAIETGQNEPTRADQQLIANILCQTLDLLEQQDKKILLMNKTLGKIAGKVMANQRRWP